MKPLMLSACFLLSVVATAATTVYRLELVSEEATGTETPYIVGADGERREVCLVEPAQYAILTGRLDQVWRKYNETNSGRQELHGRVMNTRIDMTNAVKVVTYADGYTWRETIKPRKTPKVTFANNPTKPAADQPTVDTPRRLEYLSRIREFRERTAKKTPRTVSVTHDANTGKDTVK